MCKGLIAIIFNNITWDEFIFLPSFDGSKHSDYVSRFSRMAKCITPLRIQKNFNKDKGIIIDDDVYFYCLLLEGGSKEFYLVGKFSKLKS